jgi:hypothetical protein
MKRSFAILLAAGATLAAAQHPPVMRLNPQHHDATCEAPGTIIVPASDFFATIPAGDSNDGRLPAGMWFFNNNTLNMSVPADVTASITVKEAGSYHLFVRSIGTPGSSFKVVVNGHTDAGTYGHGPLAWQQGGDFVLKPGAVEIRLTTIQPRPSLNVLVLTKNSSFKEEDLKSLELPAEVKLLHQYKIEPSNIVKFGDVDGSGKYSILDITPDYSAIMYANDGHELWRWKAPAQDARLRGEFEAPGVLWDFHHTGRDEVAHWRFLDGKEWLVLADGRDGSVIRKVPWPAPPMPHVYNNYRMAVAKFHPGEGPDTLLVLSDTGGLISLTAYDKELNMLWQHAEHRAKDYFGHYIYPYDVNGDGIDEVIISHLCLDAKGHEVWNNARYFQDNHDHMDAMEFLDINGDGKPELMVGQSDVGTLAYNAQNGDMIWHNLSDHSQQVTAGWILNGSKTPQVVTNGRTYTPRPSRPANARQAQEPGRLNASSDQIAVGGGLGAQLYWFDSLGRQLEKWPAHPLSGNPNFVRGDWYGTGKRTFFWFRFKLEPDGGATLFFKGEVYHMFDFDHTGAEQVITLDGETMRVYGNTNVAPHSVKRNAEYHRLIANHTHY